MVTFVTRHAQRVVVCFVCHSKRVVLCVRRVPVKALQLNSQFVVGLTCQSVDVVQPEPELAAQVTEALFVVGPVSVEIDGAVESFLEDSPPPSFCGLVAENVKGLIVVRTDFKNAAGCEGLKAYCAVIRHCGKRYQTIKILGLFIVWTHLKEYVHSVAKFVEFCAVWCWVNGSEKNTGGWNLTQTTQLKRNSKTILHFPL